MSDSNEEVTEEDIDEHDCYEIEYKAKKKESTQPEENESIDVKDKIITENNNMQMKSLVALRMFIYERLNDLKALFSKQIKFEDEQWLDNIFLSLKYSSQSIKKAHQKNDKLNDIDIAKIKESLDKFQSCINDPIDVFGNETNEIKAQLFEYLELERCITKLLEVKIPENQKLLLSTNFLKEKDP